MWTILEAYEIKAEDSGSQIEILPDNFRPNCGWEYVGRTVILTNKNGHQVTTKITGVREHFQANDSGTVGFILPISLNTIKPGQTMMRFLSNGRDVE